MWECRASINLCNFIPNNNKTMEHINKTEIARNVLIQAFLLTMKDSQYDMLSAMQDFIRLKPDKMLQTLRGNSKYLRDWAINEWIPEEDEKTPSTIQEGVQQVKLAALECGIPQLTSEIESLEQELQRIKKFIEFAEIDKRATEDSGQTKETELQKRQASKVRKAGEEIRAKNDKRKIGCEDDKRENGERKDGREGQYG